MKKILFLLALLFNVLAVSAQKDVTKFLGIPVDGTKTAMRQKLIAKGFTPNQFEDTEFLEGEFNGEKVRILIVTNSNKVCRIMVCDVNTLDEAKIRIRFNNLVRQFQKNEKYLCFIDATIPESENIGYEMSVKKKTYEAHFYQEPDMQKMDTLGIGKSIAEELLKKYTEEQLANPTEEILKERDYIASKISMEWIEKKFVWFRIERFYGQYYIAMYYDNEYNRANGEDL